MVDLQLSEPVYGEASVDESALIDQLEAQAEADYADCEVTMRGSGAWLSIVRRAAAEMGIPFETYILQAAYRQAVADLPNQPVTASGMESPQEPPRTDSAAA